MHQHPCCHNSTFHHTSETHLFNTFSIVNVSINLLGNCAHDCVEFSLNARYFLSIDFFSPWSLLFGLLGLAPQGLDSSTVAHRVCTISAHALFHMFLPNTLFNSTRLIDCSLWHDLRSPVMIVVLVVRQLQLVC